METYDRILQHNDDGQGCKTCAWKKDCDDLKERSGITKCTVIRTDLKNSYKSRYANKFQIMPLIKEAESGAHEWVRENTLFVHVKGGTRLKYDSIIESIFRIENFVPYRGTPGEPCVFPTVEDCSEVEEEIEDMGKEYVVIHDFTIHELSKTDIDPEIFKYIVGCHCSATNWPGPSYSVGFEFKGWSSIDKEAAELLRLGFIEEKVDDPMVKCGDWFSHKDALCQIVCTGDYEMGLVNINTKSANIGRGGKFPGSYRVNVDGIPSFRCYLSKIVGKSRLSEFKPVKIEIREV